MDDPSTPELKRLDRVLGWSIALAVVLYVVGMALLYVPDVVGNGAAHHRRHRWRGGSAGNGRSRGS